MTYLETLGAERKARLIRMGRADLRPQTIVSAPPPPPTPPVDIEESSDLAPAALERNAPALRITRGEMVKLILSRVCAEFDVPKFQLLGDRRGGAISRPRQAAMYLIHGILGFSLPQTGRVFKRDHTTVMHARDRCIRQIAEKTLWGERIIRLEMLLRDQWDMPKYDLFRYAPIAIAEDYVRLGWLPLPALEGTHHGHYSVLMKWICQRCPPIEPRAVP